MTMQDVVNACGDVEAEIGFSAVEWRQWSAASFGTFTLKEDILGTCWEAQRKSGPSKEEKYIFWLLGSNPYSLVIEPKAHLSTRSLTPDFKKVFQWRGNIDLKILTNLQNSQYPRLIKMCFGMQVWCTDVHARATLALHRCPDVIQVLHRSVSGEHEHPRPNITGPGIDLTSPTGELILNG
jgi:hypothetical protein